MVRIAVQQRMEALFVFNIMKNLKYIHTLPREQTDAWVVWLDLPL